jgi:hypothetical protein
VPAPTFGTGVDTVLIYATVRDSDGRAVLGLTREDFKVSVDGHPVELTQFSNDPSPSRSR